MGLKTIVDSLDGISEELKNFYTKTDDGKFVLDVDNIDSHPAVAGLSSTKTKERNARKQIEKDFKALKAKVEGIDLDKLNDVDLDAYDKMIEELDAFKNDKKTREHKKLKDKDGWEKLEQELKRDHSSQLKTTEDKFNASIGELKSQLAGVAKDKDEELLRMSGTLEHYLKDKKITEALAEVKGNIPILMPHISKFIKIIKTEAGTYEERVFGSEGNERYDNLGKPMTIKGLVAEFKEKPEFQGDGIFEKEKKAGGSGSSANTGTDDDDDDKKNPFSKEGFNLTEQAKLFNSDPQKAEKLRAQAAGKG